VFVLLVVGVAFQSVVIPLRTVYTIALTVFWTYGVTVYIYQDDALGWMGIAGLANKGATEWLVPIVSFPILVGISLDYDIFLITRIMELRLKGHSNLEAVRLGVCHTGHIITTAGIIMAIAFSGLLFSSLDCANELSSYMVIAVLFDTFVIRTALVPAIMSICGDWNWWPRPLPAFLFAGRLLSSHHQSRTELVVSGLDKEPEHWQLQADLKD
jgi:uncharacterized membrane protein YdfJ with MMPL/SSD domain